MNTPSIDIDQATASAYELACDYLRALSYMKYLAVPDGNPGLEWVSSKFVSFLSSDTQASLPAKVSALSTQVKHTIAEISEYEDKVAKFRRREILGRIIEHSSTPQGITGQAHVNNLLKKFDADPSRAAITSVSQKEMDLLGPLPKLSLSHVIKEAQKRVTMIESMTAKVESGKSLVTPKPKV